MKCKGCGADLDLTAGACPACGASVELARLTGILGRVCRACDSYNEPGARICAACGKPLGATEASLAAAPPPSHAAPGAPAATPPPARGAPAPPAGGGPHAGAPPPPAQPPALTLAAPPGSPVLRAIPSPASGSATRFVPAVLRPSPPKADKPAAPVPPLSRCPRCGADVGAGRFCSHCGQPLASRGTQIMMKSFPSGRSATGLFGAIEPRRAKLVVEQGGGPDGATFRLEAETTEAGRSKGAVTFPEDPCLAPHHATFFYRAGSLHVRDEGAPGGVFLRLRGLSVPLRPGDLFAIGNRLLRYAGPVPAAPTPPQDGTRRLGSPRPASPAAVIEEWLEGGATGRVFVRAGPGITIGRAGCSVNLGDDRHLSQAHAEILLDASGNARLKDLGSANGTFVKIPPHGERELHDGDRVRIGREVLRVGADEEVLTWPSSS